VGTGEECGDVFVQGLSKAVRMRTGGLF